jgi:hypothetical protein
MSWRKSGASPGRWRLALPGVLALSLLLVGACWEGAGVGGSRIDSVPPSAAPVVAPPAVAPVQAAGASTAEAPVQAASTAGAAVATAREDLENALRRAFAGGKPSAEQVRDDLVAAGFAAADVQVTAGRTPTGLEAGAVEVGVKRGGDCLVAQVRSGAVSVSVLPVLADGRCLVGAAGP